MYQVTAGSERARIPGICAYLAASIVATVLSRLSLVSSGLRRTWSRTNPANSKWTAAKKPKKVFLWIGIERKVTENSVSSKTCGKKIRTEKNYLIFLRRFEKFSDLTLQTNFEAILDYDQRSLGISEIQETRNLKSGEKEDIHSSKML